MLDFNRIVDEVCGWADRKHPKQSAAMPANGGGRAVPSRDDPSPSACGAVRTASRNHYEWSLAPGLRTGDRVRLEDGREGALTAPFPGCRGDGDWCGVFLDDGSEENIRPDRIAAVIGAPPGRKAADGQTVRYVVEFLNLGTDHMSAKTTRYEGGDKETAGSRDHERSSDLLQALVGFEGAGQDERPPPGGIHGDAESELMKASGNATPPCGGV